MIRREFDYCIVTHNEDKMNIEYYNDSGIQSIQRSNIAEINNFYTVHLKRQPIHYSFRTILLGIAALIISLILLSVINRSGMFLVWVSTIILGGGILSGLIEGFVDPILGTNFGYKIWSNFYGIKGFNTIIKDKNGIDAINVFVSKEEKNQFLTYIKTLKVKTIKSGQANGKKDKDSSTSNSIGYDEIKELSELHKNGIITDEEFAAKKKQILGL